MVSVFPTSEAVRHENRVASRDADRVGEHVDARALIVRRQRLQHDAIKVRQAQFVAVQRREFGTKHLCVQVRCGRGRGSSGGKSSGSGGSGGSGGAGAGAGAAGVACARGASIDNCASLTCAVAAAHDECTLGGSDAVAANHSISATSSTKICVFEGARCTIGSNAQAAMASGTVGGAAVARNGATIAIVASSLSATSTRSSPTKQTVATNCCCCRAASFTERRSQRASATAERSASKMDSHVRLSRGAASWPMRTAAIGAGTLPPRISRRSSCSCGATLLRVNSAIADAISPLAIRLRMRLKSSS